MNERPEGERRKDVNTRKVIEVLSEKMARLLDETLGERFKSVVTWERLIFILGAAAVVIVSASWRASVFAAGRTEEIASRAQVAAHDAKAETVETRKQLTEDMRELKMETASKVDRIDAKVEALYMFFIEGKSRAAAKTEVQRRTGD